jgi:methionyl-tRNA synthetase
MLKAMNVEMPETIFAHGWWLTGREKMSKSLGNVINPMDMIEKCGVDAFRYFLLAEMSPGNDASFTEESFTARYNSDLANDLGNFFSRIQKMTLRSFDGIIPEAVNVGEDEAELIEFTRNGRTLMEKALNEMKLDAGINAVMDIVRAGNRYLEKTAPWTLAKKGEIDKLKTVLYTSCNAIYHVSVLLSAVMPEKMAELQRNLGVEVCDKISTLDVNKNVVANAKISDCGGLFPRIIEEKVEEKAAPKTEKNAKQEKKAAAPKEVEVNVANLVTIDEFFKTQLKTAKVLQAEKVEGADKLLKLQIQVGEETRQLVAGIALYYKPEEVVGKNIVIVANLVPAKIRGIESQGMLLAAKIGKDLKLITTDGEIASGASVG